jgi:hypothetical protein
MNKRIFFYTVLCIFIFTIVCGCSAKPIDRAKIAEEELLYYDSFYTLDDIHYDLDNDFDLAIDRFNTVYDPEKNIVGFNITAMITPKFEKEINDCGILLRIDESLRDFIQTENFAPLFNDDELLIHDDTLLFSFKPYDELSLGASVGLIFYSIPLDNISKDEMILQVKEGIYISVIKNKKIGPLQKITYDGVILRNEDTLDPLGSPEPLLRRIR